MDLGSRFCNFCKCPRILIIFLNTIFRCSSNINLESDITSRCFWDDDWETLVLLKTNGGWNISFALQLKINSWAYLVGSGLKLIFLLKGPVIYYFQTFIEIFCKCLSVMYNEKQKSIIWKQLCIDSEVICKIINVI